ncbi:hypothetical protein [Planktosalinus lacus]|uniref:Uncharacterized protein n=1 Tax=Planktosalinus lacus TaxID=1526573 RepID=A0A8J2V9S2_9FLAO|nr:hypothetical protein [Planktosalinus lacus]GGD90981.1 hypothetical protein GCM10011312_13480 [Planktosalinus lacus]
MNIRISLLLVLFVFITCADQKTKQNINQQNITEQPTEPLPDFDKIIEAHGGKVQWNSANTFQFTTNFPFENSTYKVDLPNERIHIQNNDFTAAFDGKDLWLQDENKILDQQTFKRQFDLAYYIASGPFAFLQKGTLFTQRLDEEVMRKNYGVIHIGFGRGSGKSPDDEYVLYYDKETYKLAWFGYTVVNYGRYKSKRWEFVKYSSFQEVSGFEIPNSIEIFYGEKDMPSKLKRASTIENIEISDSVLPETLFEAPTESDFIN